MTEGIEAFPLAWPTGWPRTQNKKRSIFKTSFTNARDGAMREVTLLGGRHIVLSTNIPLRKDGLPYSGMAQPQDTGAAIYFTYKGKPMCFACDRWTKIEDNIWAVAKSIEAMRGLERWGASDMLDRAFTGFAALPPPTSAQAWHQVLGVSESASFDEIKKARNKLAMKYHPDNGESPSVDMMSKVNRAFEEAEKRTGGR